MALPGISKEEIALRNLHNASRERLLNAANSPKASQAVKGELRRMAGDRLKNTADDIIDELREVEGIREDSLIQEAMDDLYSLRERNKDIAGEWDEALGSANIGREYLNNATNLVDGDIQMVSGIDAATPQAVQLNWASDNVNGTAVPTQTRFHTRYEENPVTGQQDVLPMRDVSSNAPLVTQLGVVGQSVRPQDVDFMDSDEFLGKRIMQLQGIPVEANNVDNKYAVDLVRPDNNAKIDVELLKKEDLARNGTVGFQVYTEMAPASMAGARPRNRNESRAIAGDMRSAIEPMLGQRMSEGKMSLMDAIDSLDREGLLTNSGGYASPLQGKLLKEGGSYVDGLVHPVTTAENAKLNLSTRRGRNDTRKYVMPLEGAKRSDANRAKDLLSDLKGSEGLRQLSLRPMPGNDGATPSVKAYLQVPQNSSMVQNLEGAVRQLFAEQKKKPSVRRVSR